MLRILSINPMPGGITGWATLFLGEINMGTWPSRLGILKFETRKLAMSPAELRPEKDFTEENQ
jgi:hypothetical protein